MQCIYAHVVQNTAHVLFFDFYNNLSKNKLISVIIL